MGIGDVHSVEGVPDCYCVDTGMFDEPEFGAVYIYDTDRPAIIDTGVGTNYENVLEGLREVGIEPDELESILLTHIHLDHAGGAGFLVEETDADVYVHESGKQFITDPGGLWEGTKEAVGDQIVFYTEPEPVPEGRIETFEDGDAIDLGGATLDVHRAPGHAFHQVMFHDADAAAVFAADAAGIYVPTLDAVTVTSPPPGFDLEAVVADARAIEELDPETICYAHFGPAPLDDRIDEYVEAITEWVEAVEEKRAELGDDEAVIEHFIEESELTEVWNETKAPAEISMNVRGVFHYLDDADE
jgi:glyoxylase-like metal-dependent hydrolase (beta-lactamase superfamily II)